MTADKENHRLLGGNETDRGRWQKHWRMLFRELRLSLLDFKALLLGLLNAVGICSLFGIEFAFEPIADLVDTFRKTTNDIFRLVPFIDVSPALAGLITVSILCFSLWVRGFMLGHPSFITLAIFEDNYSGNSATKFAKKFFSPGAALIVGAFHFSIAMVALAMALDQDGNMLVLVGPVVVASIVLLWFPRALFCVLWSIAFLFIGDYLGNAIAPSG